MKKWVRFSGWMVLGSLALSGFVAGAAELPVRPPQYVMLAFDGSYNLEMWKETLDFARESRIKFTYFISGVYFLQDSKKNQYVEPTHGAGKSAIGFGGSSLGDIRSRVGWVNTAHEDGNEIASHANGHFDGSKWSLANWRSEFDQFYHLIFDVFQINGIDNGAAAPYAFSQAEVRGFRAPLLGQNAALYQVLREKKYSYDTSKVAPTSYWPERINGIWNFPLAEVRIAGTGKKTLSMDYNFYFTQSGAKSNPSGFARYKKEMLDTYLAYFASNYHGNRAPVHIGHHFSKWNGGAYWEAMKEFAREVCSLPDVKCVTYRELDQYLERLPATTLAQYRAGKFDRSGMPMSTMAFEGLSVFIDADLRVTSAGSRQAVLAEISGRDSRSLVDNPESTMIWTLDGQEILRGRAADVAHLDLARFHNQLQLNSQLAVSVELNGTEVLKATHRVEGFSEGPSPSPILSADPDEKRALMGDLPEAHIEEE